MGISFHNKIYNDQQEFDLPDDKSGMIALTSDIPASINTGNLVFVDSVSDLPDPVGGVITLGDGITYFFTTAVDLNGSRIVAGQNTTLLGGSSENCSISSTGLDSSTALITSGYSMPCRNITFTHGKAINLNANGVTGAALDWFGVNFLNCETIGTIANYNNCIFSDCGVLNSSNWTFDGTISTVGFSQCILDGRSGQTTITIPSSATITRRFRIIYSAAIALSGETAINVSTSASIPVEGYILDTVTFSGGGTYTAGVLYTDNKSLFVNCKGINNSSEIAQYYMQNNATATVITVNVPTKVLGTTTASSINQKFSHSNNRATYTGAITRDFKVTIVASVTSGNTHQVGLYVAKNGTILTESETYATTSGAGRAENIVVQTILQLAQNDYVEAYVENETSSTNVTAEFLSVIVEALN